MTMKGLDLGLILAALFTGGGSADGPLAVAAKEQSIGPITIKIGDEARITIASTSVRDFRMRALPRAMMDLAAGGRSATSARRSPTGRRRTWRSSCRSWRRWAWGPSRSRESPASSASRARPRRTALASTGSPWRGIADSPHGPRPGPACRGAGARIGLGDFTLDGMDFAGLIAATTKAAAAGVDPDPAEMLPKIGLIRIAGVDIDAPDNKNPRERVKLKLGAFRDLYGGAYRRDPDSAQNDARPPAVRHPRQHRENGLKDILDLGYKSLDVSAGYDLSWQEARKVLSLNDLNVRSEGMFALKATAELANVPRELFTLDKAKAAVAALGVLGHEDRGVALEHRPLPAPYRQAGAGKPAQARGSPRRTRRRRDHAGTDDARRPSGGAGAGAGCRQVRGRPEEPEGDADLA